MQISYSHKFIFIHIYKVAGSSIDEALDGYSFNPNHKLVDKVLRKLRLHAMPFYRYRNFHRHITAEEVKNTLPSDVYRRFFKFAFVRNPWDWQVSLFHWTLETPKHYQHNLFKSMSGFDEYVRWRVRPENRKLQKSFVTDQNGELIIDFVGKFERINKDFQNICNVLNISTNLPHVNWSNHQDYRIYYDKTTQKLIEDHYAEDIEFFGYKYEA